MFNRVPIWRLKVSSEDGINGDRTYPAELRDFE